MILFVVLVGFDGVYGIYGIMENIDGIFVYEV